MSWLLSEPQETKEYSWFERLIYIAVQAYLGEMVGSFPDHHKKASITRKQAVIFQLAEGPAFNL